MTFLNANNPTPSSRHFAPACVGLLICSFLSVLNINLFGESISLLLLPLLIVSLWPRRVNNIMSIVTLCLIGILMDWGTNGALGQWSLIFLAVFAVLRPDRRDGNLSFIGAIMLWLIGLAIGVIMLIVTGWLVYGVLPNFAVLFRQALLVSVLLPLVISIRRMVRFFLTDPHDRGY